MARPKRNVLSIVPPAEAPRDCLALKLDEFAISLADEMKGQNFDVHEKTEALKALTSYFAATRGKCSGVPAPSENAFSRYRAKQADAP